MISKLEEGRTIEGDVGSTSKKPQKTIAPVGLVAEVNRTATDAPTSPKSLGDDTVSKTTLDRAFVKLLCTGTGGTIHRSSQSVGRRVFCGCFEGRIEGHDGRGVPTEVGAKEGWRVGVVGACVDGAPVTINEGEAEGAALLSNSILTRLFDESITNSVRTPILF
jgi:hypothetical protein